MAPGLWIHPCSTKTRLRRRPFHADEEGAFPINWNLASPNFRRFSSATNLQVRRAELG
jgi:hypothetical protein